MEEVKLIVNKPYFRVLYASESMIVPDIDTYFYLGKNINNNEKEDTYYFQDSYSYQTKGSILEKGHNEDCTLLDMKTNSLHLMQDFDELIVTLNSLKAVKRNIVM